MSVLINAEIEMMRFYLILVPSFGPSGYVIASRAHVLAVLGLMGTIRRTSAQLN